MVRVEQTLSYKGTTITTCDDMHLPGDNGEVNKDEKKKEQKQMVDE